MPEMLACFPETVKFNPLVGLKSFRTSGAGGAWRLVVLAKTLEENGIGKVSREALRAFALSLGVHAKSFERWLTAARNFDFVQDVQTKDGEWVLILASHENVARSLGCKHQGRAVNLPSNMLFIKGWKSRVFASWQSASTNNGERLVSQKKQAEVTGILEQTQRKFNKEAGVISKKNYAISNIHANGYNAVLDFGNRAGLFGYWDKEKHQKYLGWRIPNSRYFPLFGVDGSYKTRRALSLFNRTAEQYSASMKAIRTKGTKLSEIYVYSRVSSNGNSLWIHLPLK